MDLGPSSSKKSEMPSVSSKLKQKSGSACGEIGQSKHAYGQLSTYIEIPLEGLVSVDPCLLQIAITIVAQFSVNV
jgi:hypothetical protein